MDCSPTHAPKAIKVCRSRRFPPVRHALGRVLTFDCFATRSRLTDRNHPGSLRATALQQQQDTDGHRCPQIEIARKPGSTRQARCALTMCDASVPGSLDRLRPRRRPPAGRTAKRPGCAHHHPGLPAARPVRTACEGAGNPLGWLRCWSYFHLRSSLFAVPRFSIIFVSFVRFVVHLYPCACLEVALVHRRRFVSSAFCDSGFRSRRAEIALHPAAAPAIMALSEPPANFRKGA